ncbi:MAG: family 10 glycosylhydrolase [Anaerolineae bacterium]|jgi:uncharacterized lipoprotein YddW (UPF0748 family)
MALALGGLLIFEYFVQLSDGTRGPHLTQAWTIQHGDARSGTNLSGSRPDPHLDRFPSSSDSVGMPLSVTFDHQVFLPLVRRTGLMTEARALWVTRWDYSTITDVRMLVENASQARFNMLLFQVRGTADAFYSPGLEPWGAQLSGGTLGEDPGWDPLQTAIEAAHARDLELHAYINAYPVWAGQRAPPTATVPQHLFWTLSYSYTWDDWRVVNSDGVTMTLRKSYLWATPALTDVVDRIVSVATDLVSRYDVDGIHLDLVRYPGRDTSYDPFSNAGYEAALAREPDLTRAEWQRRQVTHLVNRVYSEAILPRSGLDLSGGSLASSGQIRPPSLRLSAAVWPIYQDHWGWGYKAGYSDFYQDSQGWVQSGTIDAIMPMLYTGMFISYPNALTPTQFSLVASDFLAHDGGRHVFPGISAENLDFAGIAERIAIARDLGAPGHAIFSAGVLAQKGYWDELATGLYATPAAIPPIDWRP